MSSVMHFQVVKLAMGSSSTEQYCLRWNDFQTNVANAFSDIRDEEDFLDVTLVRKKLVWIKFFKVFYLRTSLEQVF